MCGCRFISGRGNASTLRTTPGGSADADEAAADTSVCLSGSSDGLTQCGG